MSLEHLLAQIDAIPWFTRLGEARESELMVPVTDLVHWTAFVSASSVAEFSLGHDQEVGRTYPFSVMEWLPTSNDQPDPVHGDTFSLLASQLNSESQFVTAKLEGFKRAIESQRATADHPALTFGASDHNQAARSAGRYACRMAAAETVLGRCGFWCEMVDIYSAGNWPMALLPAGKVLVL